MSAGLEGVWSLHAFKNGKHQSKAFSRTPVPCIWSWNELGIVKTSSRLIEVVGFALILCGVNARAADWLDRTYLNVDIGPSFVQDAAINWTTKLRPFTFRGSRTVEFQTGIRGDVAVGYNMSDAWAIELESGMMWNATGDEEQLYQIPILVNVIYKIPLKNSWTPYFGAGAGGVVSDLSLLTAAAPFASLMRTSDTDLAFAYQAMAGIKYAISGHAQIDLGYKFFGTLDQRWASNHSGFSTTLTSNGIYTHAVLASFTWRF